MLMLLELVCEYQKLNMDACMYMQGNRTAICQTGWLETVVAWDGWMEDGENQNVGRRGEETLGITES